jgi:hypothetical protein
MRIRFVVALMALLGCGLPTAGEVYRRTIPCKTPENTTSCYWTHGRIGFYNGTPAIRLWKIGTNRLLGIYSGPSVDRYGLDNEDPQMPASLKRTFEPSQNQVFGDFEVCPLEPEREGAMQAACIESAKNLVVN